MKNSLGNSFVVSIVCASTVLTAFLLPGAAPPFLRAQADLSQAPAHEQTKRPSQRSSQSQSVPNPPLSASPSADARDELRAFEQADTQLVDALSNADRTEAEKWLDIDFMWTNAAGETITRAKALASWPKTLLGDESAAQVTATMYGPEVGVTQVAYDKSHILRVWVKRPVGWRLLDYQKVLQRWEASPAVPSTAPTDCENPCKTVPYTPKNATQKAVLAAWSEFEASVFHHDPETYGARVLDDFVLVSSTDTDPATKSERLVQVRKPGVGPAPPPLASTPPARFFSFGDTVLMVTQTKPYSGRPQHESRIWVNRDGAWRMAFSYQTTIQSAPKVAPPKG